MERGGLAQKRSSLGTSSAGTRHPEQHVSHLTPSSRSNQTLDSVQETSALIESTKGLALKITDDL